VLAAKICNKKETNPLSVRTLQHSQVKRRVCEVHQAIEVLTQGRVKLGYAPKNHNPVLVRLMDVGKLIVAEVASVGIWDGWGSDMPEVRLALSLRE